MTADESTVAAHSSPPAEPPQPILRTLAPLLRGLERRVRSWLDGRRKFPLTMLQRAELEGLADDLCRQGEALDVDRPLLVVMLMGGTGVGKSTLLNALAGGPIAQASFTRPTTRDPVVYFHHSVRPDRLDPALRLCRLAQHDREGLLQKVIVDTPDLDSNDLANRDKLKALLPIADIVLYVGSQEKYHDRLGWDLFKEQRRRRAFAFVLNKWDRCVTGESGLRPDEDLLNDLKSEGFTNPLLFRTTAQSWLDAATNSESWPPRQPSGLPEGEQFALLRNWLEMGLTRLEIEAVKARGVGQLLATLARVVDGARPPDLSAEADKVKEAWHATLADEAAVQADVLAGTLDPYRTEVEHHFSVQDQQRYRGLMAAYLRLTTRMRYAGSSLRDRIPFAGRLLPGGRVETPVEWNLGAFVHECARSAGERVLDQRTAALVNRLLVEGDQKGFPLNLLNDPTAASGRLDWRERATRGVIDALAEVEREATHPTGWRRAVRGTLGLLANTLPELSFISTAGILLYRFMMNQEIPDLFKMSLVILLPLMTVAVFHLLIILLVPVRWPAIRDRFRAPRSAADRGVGACLPADSRRDCYGASGRTKASRCAPCRNEGSGRVARGEAARRPGVGAVRDVIVAEEQMADGKWIEGLTPTMPVAEAAALALATRFEVVTHFLPLAVDKPYDDPEYIHQLRVGTRRAGAALRAFADCLPRKHMRSAKRSLRKLRRASGEARDWDVFLLGLTHSTSLKAANGRAALDFLAGYATGERSAAQAELVEAAAEGGPTFVEESIALPALAHEPSGDAAAANFGELAAKQFGDLLKAFTEAATAKPNDPAAMHRLRILGKRLRYALELFSGCFPPAFEEVVYPAVERLQELLGGVQDATVGLERLSRLRDRIKKSLPSEWPRIAKGFEGQARALRTKLPAGRKAFQKWRRDWTKLMRDLKLGSAVVTVTV